MIQFAIIGLLALTGCGGAFFSNKKEDNAGAGEINTESKVHEASKPVLDEFSTANIVQKLKDAAFEDISYTARRSCSSGFRITGLEFKVDSFDKYELENCQYKEVPPDNCTKPFRLPSGNCWKAYNCKENYLGKIYKVRASGKFQCMNR